MFGRGVNEGEYSERIAAEIDAEVKSIMTAAMERAKNAITEHRKALDAIAKRLMEAETIEREEFEKLLVAHGIVPKRKKDIEHQA